MEFHRFMGLLAAFIGVMGAVFLAKGVLSSSPRDILSTFYQYSHIGYPSATQIASKSDEKANTLVGICLVLLAFLLQAVALMTKANPQKNWLTLTLLVCIALIVVGVSGISNLAISNLYKKSIGRIAVNDYCISRLERESPDPVNIRSLESMTNELLGLKKGEGESTDHFVRRVAEYIKWQVPEHMHFPVPDSTQAEER